MVYRELEMIEVREVLRRFTLGELVRAIARGTRVEPLTAQRAQVEGWLAEGLRLTKIYRRLAAQGVRVPYSSLHRFAQRQLGFGAAAVTVRVVEPPPGEWPTVSAAGSLDRPRRPGSGVEVLRRRAAPAGRR